MGVGDMRRCWVVNTEWLYMGWVGEMVDDCVGWGILSGYIWVRWWMVVWGGELCGYFDL